MPYVLPPHIDVLDELIEDGKKSNRRKNKNTLDHANVERQTRAV